MPRNLKTQVQLQAQISQLKQENVRLRTLLRIILDTAHLAVNSEEEKQEESSQPQTLHPCANCKKNINLETNQGWKYEWETARYFCDDCLNPKKEVNHA